MTAGGLLDGNLLLFVWGGHFGGELCVRGKCGASLGCTWGKCGHVEGQFGVHLGETLGTLGWVGGWGDAPAGMRGGGGGCDWATFGRHLRVANCGQFGVASAGAIEETIG